MPTTRMALKLALNGKVQRPGVCNALECLLVHRDEAADFLPELAAARAAGRIPFLPGIIPFSRATNPPMSFRSILMIWDRSSMT